MSILGSATGGSGATMAMAVVSIELLMATPTFVGAIFVFALGACVGSFLNVVAYRVPAGRSVVSPPSRCPSCGSRLRWHENLPVLGWLVLRGRCRRCRCSISLVYPAMEVFTGLLFLALFLTLYTGGSTGLAASLGNAWWQTLGFAGSWPGFVVVLTLFGCLVAATLIDARTFLIPAVVTNVLGGTAVLGWGVQAMLPNTRWGVVVDGFPLSPLSPAMSIVVLGASLGLAVSIGLLWTGRMRRSFEDYEDFVEEGELIAEYPHARREMLREIAFLAPAGVGAIIGLGVVTTAGASWQGSGEAQLWSVLAAVGLGWLVGGALVWVVRILGTLAFGREAMGMGDVHLLAAIGAALGWEDPIRIFFIAPFLALGWVLIGRVVSLLRRKPGKELPYGPHLAAATVVVWFGRPLVDWFESSVLLPPP